ncbi:DUF3226 domain-containing protein [Butyrivibrio sp. WCE2006]|uniref:DUF3226 domain-containing protein n=1 Tax=Butyrivibrio sp. WCE2006 TaxID=1410611 RepID=UPI000A80B909|nr:DUF3226 domain-containing protein [Butyrivibrio sp. WCE2006]
MMKIKSLIICEGNTDQILIGSYIENTTDWKYQKTFKNNPLPKESVNWYINGKSEYIGILDNGSDNFTRCIEQICLMETNEHIIDSILVVTDNDDESATEKRPKSISDIIESKLGATFSDERLVVNGWCSAEYDNWYGKVSIRLGYMLVPLNKQGALETFMLDALSENLPENKEVINQVQEFLDSFKSEVYLKGRRDRVKAKMGVSLSIFAPDKSFRIMKEIIDSVDWSKFKTTKEQFGMITELLK